MYSTNTKRLNAQQNKVLPLFPTEIISSSKDEEKALNCEENDSIASQHKATGSPLDLKCKRKDKSSSDWTLRKSLILCTRNPHWNVTQGWSHHGQKTGNFSGIS